MKPGDILIHKVYCFPVMILEILKRGKFKAKYLDEEREIFEIDDFKPISDDYVDGFYFRSNGEIDSDKQLAKWLDLDIGWLLENE